MFKSTCHVQSCSTYSATGAGAGTGMSVTVVVVAACFNGITITQTPNIRTLEVSYDVLNMGAGAAKLL